MLTVAFRKETGPGRQVTYTAIQKLTIMTTFGKPEIPQGSKLRMPAAGVLFFHQENAGAEGLYIHCSAICAFTVGHAQEFFVF